MSNFEFLIHEVQQDGEGTRVTGIVNKGSVRLNAKFVSVQSESGATSPVALRIFRIFAYRRQIPELPTGMSGELHISGDGVALLAKHCMLAD